MNSRPPTSLLDALGAPPPHPSLGEAAHVFDRFVGAWDCHCTFFGANEQRTEFLGEWIFGWILDGRLMQDVLQGYPKELTSPMADDLRCGTSLRFFDPKASQWNVCWFGSKNGFMLQLRGGPVGEQIVLDGTDNDGSLLCWSFNDIQPKSFLWRGQKSADGGRSWVTEQEMMLRRRGRAPKPAS